MHILRKHVWGGEGVEIRYLTHKLSIVYVIWARPVSLDLSASSSSEGEE